MRTTVVTHKRARNLRRQTSLPERLLWRDMREAGIGGRFRRQHPFGPYILDFYSPTTFLALEVDGSAHGLPDAMAHDDRRDAWLAGQGVRVLRFPAKAVLDDERRDGVLTVIRAALAGTLNGRWEV